jgi:hypothetical protein
MQPAADELPPSSHSRLAPSLLIILPSFAASFCGPTRQDKDGVIWPWDTARGFREIGYNPLIAGLAPLFIHSGMSLPTQARRRCVLPRLC